jgi:hypothetical protein
MITFPGFFLAARVPFHPRAKNKRQASPTRRAVLAARADF